MAGSIAHSDRPAAVRRVLDAVAEALRTAARAAEPEASVVLEDFARLVSAVDATRIAATASPLERVAVCRLWDDALRASQGRLVAPLAALGPWLSWTQNPNYRRRPPDAAFLDNVTLTSAGEWWRDDGPWRREPPGAAIHHAPNVPHATRAGATPLLALYVWRGELATNARLTS
jgi:hypothetical protein